MPYFSQVRINNLGDYINEIIRLKVSGEYNNEYFRWYRGHADISWELIPKVQRGFSGTDEELLRRERFLTHDFQARASIIPSPKPEIDKFANWLTLMQHYGLATRLLDWSRSPLVALYFAVSDVQSKDKNACVWILTPGKLNEHEELEKPTVSEGIIYDNTYIYHMAHKTIYTMIYTAFRRWKYSSNSELITKDDQKFGHRIESLKDKIAACYPTEADHRVYNQLAAFTVHNSLKRLTEICDDSTLKRIEIPHNKKADLLYELMVCGITQSYIYPDLEHIANEINVWQSGPISILR